MLRHVTAHILMNTYNFSSVY